MALAGLLGYALITHLKDICVVIFEGLKICLSVFWAGATAFFSLLAGVIGGAAASLMVVSCIAIPITIVGVYKIVLKAEDRPKAMIVAVGLFLDPLFIDFFKDRVNEEHPLQKLLIGAFGVVTFLVASLLWSDTERRQSLSKSNIRRRLGKVTAVVLFLLPSLCMAGYAARQWHSSPEFVGRSPEPTQLDLHHWIAGNGACGNWALSLLRGTLIGIAISPPTAAYLIPGLDFTGE